MENAANRKHQKRCLLFTRLATVTATMICLITANSLAFAADDYLSALEGESESTAKVQSSAQHDPEYYKNLAKMETLLKSEKPSTYKFYKKLSPKYKTQVFELYAADSSDQHKRLSKIQKNVMTLYFKQ